MSWWHKFLGIPDPDKRDPRSVQKGGQEPAPTVPQYRPPGVWTMDAVEGALEQLEYGTFYAAGRLLDALLVDEYVASLIGLRIGTVTGLPTFFESISAPGTPIQIRGLNEDWQLLFPVEEQDQVLFQTLMMGFCLAYDSRDSYEQMPSWKAWPAYGVRYDVGREVWQVEDRLRGYVDVYPGDGQWALFRLRSSRPWLAGYIRAVAPMEVIRQSTLYSWANHANVYATPSRVLTAPARMAENDDVKRALAALRKLVGDSTINLLEGMKLELLELKEITYQIYQELRKAIDESLSVLFVGQAGTTKAAGGWGSAHTERRVTQQLLERDVKVLGPTTWRDILGPYDNWKRGTIDLLKVPRHVWDCTPPADLDAIAKRQETLARARLAEAQELATYAKLPALYPRLVEICKERGYRAPAKVEPPPAPSSPALQEAA